MKTAQQWLDQYGVCHRNPTNKAIHWLCVPLIYWSIHALASALPWPQTGVPWLPWWGCLMLAITQLYYFWLAPRLGWAMLGVNLVVGSISAAILLAGGPLWQIGLTVFVLAWIGQFIGHLIEGAKPSFFEDLQFLLIGPAWLVNHLLPKPRD